jgi:hypothetical protein
MSRAWFALAVAGVLGLFCVGAGLRGDAGQAAANAQEQPKSGTVLGRGALFAAPASGPASGRYQMAIRDGAADGGRSYVVICDTATGHVWARYLTPGGSQEWRDLGSPTATASRTAEEPPALEAPRLVPPTIVPGAAPALSPSALPSPARGVPADSLPVIPSTTVPPSALPPPGSRET